MISIFIFVFNATWYLAYESDISLFAAGVVFIPAAQEIIGIVRKV